MGMKFVVLVVIVLAVIAVAQIMRVYELSSKIRGKREEDIDLRVNNINASLMMVFLLVFFGSFFWMLFKYGRGMLPNAASEIGVEIDWLYNLNWWIVVAMFMITNTLLFVFAWKYAYDPKRRAHWFPHDNKLEMLWTVVPAGVLAVIIILGLMTWNKITGEPSEDAVIVEIYGKQFNWTVRYAGDDNKLGFADYKLVGTAKDAEGTEYSNVLGVVSQNSIRWRVEGINNEIADLHATIELEDKGEVAFSAAKLSQMIAKVEKLERIRERILDMLDMYPEEELAYASDDYMTKELFLIKDQEYFFILRSEDVLHSAYFPHFRAQMNCVPGQRTTLRVKPTISTQEMRDKLGNQNFNYVLLCNKICGVSHSNMNMPVIVGTAEEFDAWKNEEGTKTMALNDTIAAPVTLNTDRMKMPEAGHGGDHHDASHEEAHTDAAEEPAHH